MQVNINPKLKCIAAILSNSIIVSIPMWGCYWSESVLEKMYIYSSKRFTVLFWSTCTLIERFHFMPFHLISEEDIAIFTNIYIKHIRS